MQKLYGNYLPKVALTNPVDGASLDSAKELALTATFSTTALATGVNEVRFYQGDKRVGDAHGSPGTCTWRDAAPGDYVLTARVVDSNGNVVASAPVHVKVTPPEPAATNAPASVH